MINSAALLVSLKKQVAAVEQDLEAQLKMLPEVKVLLRNEWAVAKKLGRTAATETSWRDERVTQVAVAWVLGTVFVRFCEDNELIAEPYFTGPTIQKQEWARVRYEAYADSDPSSTYRGWLLQAFSRLGAGQAGKLLFDPARNPLYQIPISHDGARSLLEFWRARDENGALIHDFTDPLDADGIDGWDTRFLGDLYQDLSDTARKNNALLQTPDFVAEFILDRTLTPAIGEFGFEELEMIDPTCGSGHFILGTFRRLVQLWAEHHPTRGQQERVGAALSSVHGVDINPFAIAIARFRLLITAMAAANVRTFAGAANYKWPIQLAIGDSLIKAHQMKHGRDGTSTDDPLAEFSYATEDVHEYPDILTPGKYHVVVGNPPYITVKDSSLNALYRNLYEECVLKYSLTIPFIVRYFELAKNEMQGVGFVGLLSSNSYMKREFGRKIIETFFPTVDLTEVIDTSGAYIPGHGTPTVLLFGRNRSPIAVPARMVLALHAESTRPEDPELGLVWKSIQGAIDRESGCEDRWTQRVDVDKSSLWNFPWTLANQKTGEILKRMGGMESTLGSIALKIGFFGIAGVNDVLISPTAVYSRNRVESNILIPVLRGTDVRDWTAIPEESGVLLTASDPEPSISSLPNLYRMFWPYRTRMRQRPGSTQADDPAWYRWTHVTEVADAHPWSIAFAWVSTHNHFAVLRGRMAPLNSAPIIRLPKSTSDSDVLQLTSLVNSSVACFWMKHNSNSKGQPGADQVGIGEPWAEFFEFAGNRLADLPLPDGRWFQRQWTIYAETIDTLTRELTDSDPRSLMKRDMLPSGVELDDAYASSTRARARMIGLQEEIDWEFYERYGLTTTGADSLLAPAGTVPEIGSGERAFEIVLARQVADGEASNEWFIRHNSTPVTEVPTHWPEPYRQVVQRRIDTIETNQAIGMIERPEYKRRWATETREALQEKVLRSWLLDRMESRDLWFGDDDKPALQTLSQLTDRLAQKPDFVSTLSLYAPHAELYKVVAEMLTEEHVPFLPALRYKPSGLKKRADWEHVWEMQREEDAATNEPASRKIRDCIPILPNYTSTDYLRTSYWQARGKLDVPKERFISYSSTNTATPDLYGWAGWDHREQAQALATYFTNQSLSVEEITPLLAGLLELQPWLTQWHNDYDEFYSSSPAAFFANYRRAVQFEHGLTDDDLRTWRPATISRGRPRKKPSD